MDKEYFKNKYRTSTIRMNHWDYAWPAMYYITICTEDRRCCLSEIKDGQVYLLEMGNIVFEELLKTQQLRPYVVLDDFIIMPNHVHVVIIIKDNDFDTEGRDMARHVSTERKFGKPPSKSLSSIIGSFKSAVTNKCHKNNLDFQWQSNYYEHVIRDYEDLGRVREYIAHNPINWENDRNNPINIK
jgi:REP element-mobilizing transposase RayT